MNERTGGKSMVAVAGAALGIGLGVALVVGVIVTSVQSSSCIPDEECFAALAGIAWGTLAGGAATALTFLVLAIRWDAGTYFGVGVGIGVLALLGAGYLALTGRGQPFLLLAAVAFAGGALLQRCYRRSPDGGPARWTRPSTVAVVITAGVVVLGALPTVVKLAEVWTEQRRLEAVVARPLQADWDDGTWPYTVIEWDSGFEYSVLEPWSDGSRIARVTVSVHQAAPGDAPCAGFADRVEGPVTVTNCTEIQPRVWEGRGAHGEARYFVHAADGQRAYVRTGTYGPEVQPAYNQRAAEVAKSLRPRSAFPLAAASIECGFCEWLG
ncbi:hypothetical protein [Kribbella sp. NPDC048915]|uniref:hypothetical protein n=1 Tax=Kribbella sp. NPDC048915 TaxID=3155148 RepID=UPI0033E26611